MLRRNFTTLTLALIPVAIAINIAIGQLVYVLKIPIYLDSIGTVLVGLLAGPLAGFVTGALSNMVWFIIGNPTYGWYFYVAAVIGLLAGVFGGAGWARKIWLWLLAGLITGTVAALLSAPLTAYLGGVTGSGTDLIVAVLRASGAKLLEATVTQGLVSDPLDKLASFLIVWLITLALPLRYKMRFPQADKLPGPTTTTHFEA